MNTNHGATAPAILFSTTNPDLTHEVPMGLEGFPTEVEVKVGDAKKKIPVSYFEKDAIECGSFKHPTTGQEFSVDTHRLDRWVTKFDQMRAAGVEIPCPIDHSDKAEDNRGFALKMRRDGNKLKITPQVFGEDGALLALRNRCSIKIEPDFVDEKGRHWGECVSHMAFTNIPVISGQGPFVPIAASRGQQSVPVYYLSAQRSPEMDLTTLREAVGAPKDLSDEKVIELSIKKFKDVKDALANVEKARDSLSAELSRSAEKIVELSRTAPAPDPEILADRASNYHEKIEIAVAKGEMTKAFGTKIAGIVKDGDKPNAFMLSRQPALKDTRPIDFILDMFKGEKFGIAVGEVTPIQLDRQVPGEEKKPEPMTEERREELLAMAR